MNQTVETRESFPILATSSRLDEAHRILKHGESFGVFGRSGEIRPGSEQGLFHEGTRFLSQLELTLDSQRPLVLNSTVRQDNALIVDLTNPDLVSEGSRVLPRDTIHLFATCFLWEEVCYVRWRLHNFGLEPAELRLDLRFGADFADVFEVRGTPRPQPSRRTRRTCASDDERDLARRLAGRRHQHRVGRSAARSSS